MDKNMSAVVEKQIRRTMKSLENNNMVPFFTWTKEEVPGILEKLLPEGASVTHGGSITLDECGIPGFLEAGPYDYHNRDRLLPEEKMVLYRKSFSFDAYLSSVNAVTEDGLLLNIDANGNRVAAITFGPEKVILIAGYNKIHKGIDDAVYHARNIAAPANAMRLNLDTPCVKTGRCMDCKSPQRICSHFVTHGYQRIPGRIHVILVGERLGY